MKCTWIFCRDTITHCKIYDARNILITVNKCLLCWKLKMACCVWSQLHSRQGSTVQQPALWSPVYSGGEWKRRFWKPIFLPLSYYYSGVTNQHYFLEVLLWIWLFVFFSCSFFWCRSQGTFYLIVLFEENVLHWV